MRLNRTALTVAFTAMSIVGMLRPTFSMAAEQVACCDECCISSSGWCYHCGYITRHSVDYKPKKDEICWKGIRYSCKADHPPSQKTCGVIENTEEMVCKPAHAKQPEK
jgi:hypothetical protein